MCTEHAAPLWRARAVALALVALPVAGLLAGPGVGSWRMFSEPVRYGVQLSARVDGEWRELPPEHWKPHLGKDARRVLVRDGVGDTTARLVPGAAPELAQLACFVEPRAAVTRVVVQVAPLLAPKRAQRHVTERPCP